MRKLFTIIGILAGIYLVYSFLLYSSSLIFPATDGTIYECMLKKSICTDELMDIAKKNNVTTFTTEHNNTRFFGQDIVFTYLNVSSKDKIKYGRQKKLISTNKIIYKENTKKFLKVQRFWVINNGTSKFESYLDSLKQYGIQKEPFIVHDMSLFILGDIDFFLCLAMLLVFCITVYYVLRSNEIAILKLNGYKNLSISAQILKPVIKKILIGYTLVGLGFSGYVIYCDNSLLLNFIQLYLYVFMCLIIIIVFVALFETVFIAFLKVVSALKNNKNSKMLILSIIIFKLFITIVFISSAVNLYHGFLDFKATNLGYESVESKNFYYIKTSITPEEETMKELSRFIDKIGKAHVYNYSNPTYGLYGHETFTDLDQRNHMMVDPPIIRMSYNMLHYVKIYSDKNFIIDPNDLDNKTITLLVPANLSKNINEIAKKFTGLSKLKVRYIREKQEHINFLNPSLRVYNAIYLLVPVERGIYFNDGRVLFDEVTSNAMEKELLNISVDKGTVSLMSLESDYEKILDNLQLQFVDDLQFLLINALSFVVSIFAIGIAFCEFRKRELAVFKLLTQVPKRVMISLCGINALITLVVAYLIQPVFCVVVMVEILIYLAIIYVYSSKKAITVLKGE